METTASHKDRSQPRLALHRMYVKSSIFECFGVTLDPLQKPVQPTLEIQFFTNTYAQENNLHQVLLGLKIEAKHQVNPLWDLTLEQAAFYTLEGFETKPQQNILNGFL